ncbi:MAG: type II secretion system protein [Planctomycetota bacterium]
MRSSRILAHSRNARRRGLTLIELVVVLTILIALGSLLVPVIGNALNRSHVSTCAQNIPDITAMLQRAELFTGDFGNGWSTGIITGTDQPVNNSAALFTLTGGGGNTAGTLVAEQLQADEVLALADLGITTVYYHDDPTTDGFNVTFSPYDPTAAGTTLATGAEVITLTDAQAQSIYLPVPVAGEKYIWLGIDKSWSLLGTVTPEPPVHFGDTPTAFPEECYSRFGAIFKLTDEVDGDDEASAEFVRVSYCLDGTNFETADNHIGIYWDELR